MTTVPKVYVMDNLRDYMQSGFFQVERREHGFKCAAIALVSKFGPSHIECDFSRRSRISGLFFDFFIALRAFCTFAASDSISEYFFLHELRNSSMICGSVSPSNRSTRITTASPFAC